MKTLPALLLASLIAMTSSPSLAQKKTDQKHGNLAQAYSALEHAKAVLGAVQFDDEKGSRADALAHVNTATTETAECFQAIGAATPPMNAVSINKEDDRANLKAASEDISTAKKALDKAEGQEFKGHLAQAQKAIDK